MHAVPRGGAPLLVALLGGAALAAAVLAGAARAAGPVDLNYDEYQAVTQAAARFDHLAVIEPPAGTVGLYLVLGDRYGLVHIYHLTHGDSREIWKSKQLGGAVDEVRVADLDGDGRDEIIARSGGPQLYVWGGDKLDLRYESLVTDFQKFTSLTIGNVDDDPQLEIILNADRHLYYLDGKTFNREWTSLREYEATRMACGDVTGDGRSDLVLNTGQVVDSRSGDVIWADEVFGARIDLVDFDGDGVLEVLTESDGAPLRIFDVDLRKEKHLQ
jgi:hypothetical protein